MYQRPSAIDDGNPADRGQDPPLRAIQTADELAASQAIEPAHAGRQRGIEKRALERNQQKNRARRQNVVAVLNVGGASNQNQADGKAGGGKQMPD